MAYPAGGPRWPPPGPPGPPHWPPPAAFQAPASPEGSNRAHRWFVVYVTTLVVLYLAMIAGGVFLLLYDFPGTAAEVDELRFQGATLVILGIAFSIVYGVGLFLPRKQWGWVYGLVLLGLGMTSCCTWPATIPLLISWLKPEMKARFGMT